MRNQLVENVLNNAEFIFDSEDSNGLEDDNTVRACLCSDDNVKETETAIAKDNFVNIKDLHDMKAEGLVTKIVLDDMALHVTFNRDVALDNKVDWQQEWR